MDETYEEWYDKFLRSNALSKEIFALVSPYACKRLPKTPDNLLQAKNTLLDILALLRKREIPSLRSWDFGYVKQLKRIYFKLRQGDYPTVCDQIDDILGADTTEEIYRGLILLLEKVEKGDFPDTYIK